MTRVSKQEERRNKSPRKPKIGSVKSGPKKDRLKKGYKEHLNAIMDKEAAYSFISKVK